MTTKSIRAEIEANVRNGETTPEDAALLLRFLEACKTSMQWSPWVGCEWIRTGQMSYQARRRWKPTDQLRALLAA